MARTAIDLFCGAGGFSAGLQRAGFEIVAAVDSWTRAIETYRRNFDHPVLEMSIENLDSQVVADLIGSPLRELDLLVGGPPCQGFSIQRIGPDGDSRNSLVLEFARLVEELSPSLAVMENVTGILGKRGKSLATEYVARLQAAGFETAVVRTNASEWGVPQERRRVFFISHKSECAPGPLILPPGLEPVSVFDAISDLPPAAVSGGVAGDPLHIESRLSDLNRERLRYIPQGGGMEDLPIDLRVNCHKNGPEKIGHRSVYGRLRGDSPAGTITARFDSFTRGRFAHPTEDRNITLREGARLQTFQDSFTFAGNREETAALIGNAVPPLLAEGIALQLMKWLDGDSDREAPLGQLPLAL